MKKKQDRRVKTVAIIGGGVSGAITLDTLKEEGSFDKITVFERRDKLGGTWNVDSKPASLKLVPGEHHWVSDPHIATPSLQELSKSVDGIKQIRGKNSNLIERHVFSPSYTGMRTKTPERLMTFSDKPRWPRLDKEGLDFFTTTDAVREYILDYFQKYPSNVVLNTSIEKIGKDGNSNKFILYLKEETSEKDSHGNYLDSWSVQEFDAVIIATGYYHVPFLPKTPGLVELMSKHPHVVSHSKIFTNTEKDLSKYKNKIVLVIGSRPSSHDLAKFIAPYAKRVYQSYRTMTDFIFETEKIKLVPTVVSYDLTPESITVKLSNGKCLEHIDYIIYATGYKMSYPFLNETYPTFTTGNINPTLYQHIFHIDDPLLSVVGTPVDAINFKTLEYQAILISRFLAGKVSLPPIEEQRNWLDKRYKEFGDSRKYHTIGMFGAIEFADILTELGGGRKRIGESGKQFPIITQSDIDHYVKEKEKFKLDY